MCVLPGRRAVQQRVVFVLHFTAPRFPRLCSIPVSTSHICVFAAVAVGLFEGRKGVNWWMVLQTICAVSLLLAADVERVLFQVLAGIPEGVAI